MKDIFHTLLDGLVVFLKNTGHVISRFLKQITYMNRYDKILSIGVLLLVVLLLFFPLLRVSPSTSTTSISYGFLLSFSFIKSFFLVFASLIAILFLLFNKKAKIFIVEKIGFQGNYYLLIVLLLGIGLASLLAIGESLKLIEEYTTSLKLVSLFYIVQILYIVLEAFSLFVLFSGKKVSFRGHVVSYRKEKQGMINGQDGLFDENL